MGDAMPIAEAQNKASPELKAVISYLRGKTGPKSRQGVLNGKRVDYFKGKSAIKSLLDPVYSKAKGVPTVENEEQAQALMSRLLPHAFFLQTDRPELAAPLPSGQLRPLQISSQQQFAPTSYYTWFLAPSALYTYLGSALLVLVVLGGVMFPLWPPFMRLGVYYLSLVVLGLIGLFIGIALVRLVVWLATSLVMKRGVWWFPNLFEDVGFVDSFIPFWDWDHPPQKKSKKSKSEKSSKSKRTPAEPVLASSTATSIPNASEPIITETTGPSTTDSGIRHRQQAYVEDAGDDE